MHETDESYWYSTKLSQAWYKMHELWILYETNRYFLGIRRSFVEKAQNNLKSTELKAAVSESYETILIPLN